MNLQDLTDDQLRAEARRRGFELCLCELEELQRRIDQRPT